MNKLKLLKVLNIHILFDYDDKQESICWGNFVNKEMMIAYGQIYNLMKYKNDPELKLYLTKSIVWFEKTLKYHKKGDFFKKELYESLYKTGDDIKKDELWKNFVSCLLDVKSLLGHNGALN